MDDFAGDSTTTGTVSVGGTATGEIQVDEEEDWFAVDLKTQLYYQIDLRGADTGHGTLPDPIIRGIYDSDETKITGTDKDDGGVSSNTRLVFKATTTGTYYMAASGDGTNTDGSKTRDIHARGHQNRHRPILGRHPHSGKSYRRDIWTRMGI